MCARQAKKRMGHGKGETGAARQQDAPAPKRVRCAYVVEQMPTGVSGAWKVVGSDGKAYVVKFNMPWDHTALNELVCACIEEQFGLPSFEPVLVDIDGRQAVHINRGGAPAEWCTEGGGIEDLRRAIGSLDPESPREAIAGHLRGGGGA